jgi:hypothetical protein
MPTPMVFADLRQRPRRLPTQCFSRHDRFDSTTADDLVDCLFVSDIGLPKDERASPEGLYPFEGGSVTVGQIVDYHDLEPGLQQCQTDMRADVAGASGHQDHVRPLSVFVQSDPVLRAE